MIGNKGELAHIHGCQSSSLRLHFTCWQQLHISKSSIQPLNATKTCAEGYKAAFERLMDQLEWDAVLPCHGNYIGSGGKQFLKAHLKLQ